MSCLPPPLALGLAALVALAAACDAGITRGPMPGALGADGGAPGGGPEPAPDATPREVFDATVLPELLIECGSCHANDDMAVGFIAGPDAYATLMAWPRALVVPGSSAASLLITKGAHAGPALSAGARRAVVAWIVREAGPTGPEPGDPGEPGEPGGTEAPTASFVAGPDVTDPLLVTFDASASIDPDGTIVSFEWSYGDGAIGTGPTVTHRYETADTFAVALTVTDDAGVEDTVTQVLEIGTGLPQIVSMALVNADTGEDIAEHTPLRNAAIVDLAAIGTSNLSIRAETAPAVVGSVRFSVDADLDFNTENNPPYAIAGDSGGDYSPWNPAVGERVVTAMPFTESDGTGAPGRPLTVRFTVR